MPIVDRRTNSVVLRIVYDGPPEAGKTTNLRHLCQRLSLSRRGPLESPGGHERTQFFDWLDVTGGWVGGHRVRCQLVTVPGQIELARRRRHILDSADVVVFVADSRAGAAFETSAALRSLARGLSSRADVPLVLQANKQDLSGAQVPAQLHEALGLAARVPVVGAQATGGSGVLESFILAVRLAVDHVRALLVAGELGAGDATGAAELLRALEADAPAAFDALDEIARAADTPPTIDAVADTNDVTTRPIRVIRCAPARIAAAAADRGPGDAAEPSVNGVSARASLPSRNRTASRPSPPMTRPTRPIRILRFAPDEGVAIGAIALGPAVAPAMPPLAQGTPPGTAGPVVLPSGELAPPTELSPPDELSPPEAEPTRPDDPTPLTTETPSASRRGAYTGTDDDATWELPAVAPGALIAVAAALAEREWNDEPTVPVEPVEPREPTAAGEIVDHDEPSAPVEIVDHDEPSAPVEIPAAATAAPAAHSEARAVPRIEVVRDPDPAAPATVWLGVPPPPEALPFQLPPVDLPAGMVWPCVSGRAALAAFTAPVRVAERPAPWAPADAIEIACGDSWTAHTSAALVFPDLGIGRAALFDAIRWQVKLAHLTPPGRTYALAPEGDHLRLWVLTPAYRTVWAAIEEAFARGDRATAGRLAKAGLEAVDELRAREFPIADLDHIAVDDPARLLATPWTPQRDRLIIQLQRLFAAAVL